MRGRPRKPPELKVIEGNKGQRPITFGPRYDSGFGSCPKHLSGEARKHWKLLTKQLEGVGITSQAYKGMLENLCYWYGEWRRLVADVEENGRSFTVIDSGYSAPRPEYKAMGQASQNYRWACQEFGFTPASNSRVSVPRSNKQSLRDELLKANAV